MNGAEHKALSIMRNDRMTNGACVKLVSNSSVFPLNITLKVFEFLDSKLSIEIRVPN